MPLQYISRIHSPLIYYISFAYLLSLTPTHTPKIPAATANLAAPTIYLTIRRDLLAAREPLNRPSENLTWKLLGRRSLAASAAPATSFLFSAIYICMKKNLPNAPSAPRWGIYRLARIFLPLIFFLLAFSNTRRTNYERPGMNTAGFK